MSTVQNQTLRAMPPASPRTDQAIVRGAVLMISCVISFWLITHILAGRYSISNDDDILGGMWAVVATLFAYRDKPRSRRSSGRHQARALG